MKLIVVVVVVRVVIVDTTGIMVDDDDIVRTIPEFVRTNPTKPAHGGKKQKNDEVAHEGGCGRMLGGGGGGGRVWKDNAVVVVLGVQHSICHQVVVVVQMHQSLDHETWRFL